MRTLSALAGTFVLGAVAGAWVTWGSSVSREAVVSVSPALPPGPSLFHFPFRPLETTTPGGRRAALAMARTLAGEGPEGCRAARTAYAGLLRTENFGGEYGALDWLCDWLTADETRRGELGYNPEGSRIARYFDANGWGKLGAYLGTRYQFEIAGAFGGVSLPPEEVMFLHEYLRFEGPHRAEWEHTDEVLARLGLEPGDRVADLGAGQGFLALRMARSVGPKGRVYAIDLLPAKLAYLTTVVRAEGIANVTPVRGTATDLGIGRGAVDVVFVCNLYHALYGATPSAERNGLLRSIRDTLRPGGRLIISDNTPEGETPPGALPYHGYTLSASLAIAQLETAGFALEERFSVIPQRYQLVFRRL